MSRQPVTDASTPIVLPDMGRVLGCRLGASIEEVMATRPGGEVARIAEGRRTYSLTQLVGTCGASVRVCYAFVDEQLAAVTLRPAHGAPGGVERNLHRQLSDEVVASLDVAPSMQDEGYLEYDAAGLRVTIDMLDAVIRIEEPL